MVDVAGRPFSGAGFADVDISAVDRFGADFAAVLYAGVKFFWHSWLFLCFDQVIKWRRIKN